MNSFIIVVLDNYNTFLTVVQSYVRRRTHIGINPIIIISNQIPFGTEVINVSRKMQFMCPYTNNEEVTDELSAIVDNKVTKGSPLITAVCS